MLLFIQNNHKTVKKHRIPLFPASKQARKKLKSPFLGCYNTSSYNINDITKFFQGLLRG
jgi:hypothetical protein